MRTPSLVTRIAIGKGVGLIFGLIGFLSLPFFWPDVGMFPRVGVLLWYTTMGAIIGVFGIFTWHPVLHLPMPWWVRAPILGAWLNFVLTFFAYDMMASVLVATFGAAGWFTSPFWFVAEGAFVGLVIGGIATYFAGEGQTGFADRPVG
jgi:hypothetical protein